MLTHRNHRVYGPQSPIARASFSSSKINSSSSDDCRATAIRCVGRSGGLCFRCFENDRNATPTGETRRTQRKTPKSLCGLGAFAVKPLHFHASPGAPRAREWTASCLKNNLTLDRAPEAPWSAATCRRLKSRQLAAGEPTKGGKPPRTVPNRPAAGGAELPHSRALRATSSFFMRRWVCLGEIVTRAQFLDSRLLDSQIDKRQ